MGISKHKTIDRTMFYGATPLIFSRAFELRNKTTNAEKCLWLKLRNNQILGLRFKQQHPINQFITDFYCHKIKLAIEVDGEIHKEQYNAEHDEGRTCEIEKYGISVIRFSNEDVLFEINSVILDITKKCQELLDNL